MTETENNLETKTEHTGPHVPGMQGESVYGPITNTTITTFLFFIIILAISLTANKALKSKKKSKLKLFFLNFLKFFDDYLVDSFGNKKFARAHFSLIGGIFIIIFFGNLFGLMIDWLGASITPNVLHYLRPMHSDLNTTLVLGGVTVFMFLLIAVKTHGFTKTAKGYCFNFTGENFMEKSINVFVGWLHLIGIPSTMASLSLRLFGNIFAGIVLIGVISFLGGMMTEKFLEVGKLLAIPFWFFEVFVAFIQAIVFAGLMIAYFKQSSEEHH
nr:F0F1 ATP synthase subunit A [Candidatus Gracilibacteria bacterium]